MCELVSFDTSKDIKDLRDEMNQRLELMQHQLDSLLAERGGTPQRGRGRLDPPQEDVVPLVTSASYVINTSLGK